MHINRHTTHSRTHFSVVVHVKQTRGTITFGNSTSQLKRLAWYQVFTYHLELLMDNCE
jgi:hypothetical protein